MHSLLLSCFFSVCNPLEFERSFALCSVWQLFFILAYCLEGDRLALGMNVFGVLAVMGVDVCLVYCVSGQRKIL